MGNKSALKAEFQIKTIEGRIKGLAKKLFQLAPHPNNPACYGPLFISLNSAFKPAAEYDSTLGSIALESVLAGVFAQTANDNVVASVQSVNNFDNISDLLSEYLQECEETRKNKLQGQGSFALGEHKTICNQFNNENNKAFGAFWQDFAARLQIEETIANLAHNLDSAKLQHSLCA